MVMLGDKQNLSFNWMRTRIYIDSSQLKTDVNMVLPLPSSPLSPSLSVPHLIPNLKSFSICDAQSVAKISASCSECVQHLNQTHSWGREGWRGRNSFGTCRQSPVSSIYLFVRDTPNTHTHTHMQGNYLSRSHSLELHLKRADKGIWHKFA